MSSLLDPPNSESLQSVWESLQILGAVNVPNQQLTPLGMHLAGILVPPVVRRVSIALFCPERSLKHFFYMPADIICIQHFPSFAVLILGSILGCEMHFLPWVLQ